MGGVATLMITRTVLLHTLGHPHLINTGKDTDLGHIHHRPRTVAGTLTRMAVGESHPGRCLVLTIGADITLDPRAEVDTVEARGGDIIAVVEVVEAMVMETAEEGLLMLQHIRAATIPTSTMEDIVQGAEAHHEDAVEVEEATELWLLIVAPFTLALFVFTYMFLVPFRVWFRALRCVRNRGRILRTTCDSCILSSTTNNVYDYAGDIKSTYFSHIGISICKSKKVEVGAVERAWVLEHIEAWDLAVSDFQYFSS